MSSLIVCLLIDCKQDQQPRADYREFLELTLLFLGATPPRGTHFKSPGAVSNARFMARAIYCLEMFMFKTQVRKESTK